MSEEAKFYSVTKWDAISPDHIKKHLSVRQSGEQHFQTVVKDWLQIFHPGFEIVGYHADILTNPAPSAIERFRKQTVGDPVVNIQIARSATLGGFSDDLQGISIPARAFFSKDYFWAAVDQRMAGSPDTKQDDSDMLKAILEKHGKSL